MTRAYPIDDIGTINGSPFDHGDNECKYYSPENFAQNVRTPLIIHYHYFVSTVAVSVQTGIAFMNWYAICPLVVSCLTSLV